MSHCMQCGTETSNPKFCSRTCACTYNNYHANPNRKFGPTPIYVWPSCIVCGEPVKYGRKMYCSQKCRDAAKYSDIVDGKVSTRDTLRKFISQRDGWRCSICGLEEWINQPTPLVLDHIDGDPMNDKGSNLRLICPNCDAQLPTFTGRNRGNGRASRREQYQRLKSSNRI